MVFLNSGTGFDIIGGRGKDKGEGRAGLPFGGKGYRDKGVMLKSSMGEVEGG